MNKQKFIELVENPSGITEKDAGILAELARNYPYSPLVHTLLAKALQQNEGANASLATAALYIPDRSVLKAVMEDQLLISSASETSIPPQEKSSGEAGQALNSAAAIVPEQEIETKNNVFLELQENLRKLKEQRDRFENQEAIESSSENPEQAEASSSTAASRFGALPEALQEILDQKEEKEINDPKRVEQINLIDNFIKNSSSISRKYRTSSGEPEEQNDLTSTYSFTPPDLATENLAQIMVRQGKTEKAIDIYEKLILKYPQKKAYFATCIEKLKTT